MLRLTELVGSAGIFLDVPAQSQALALEEITRCIVDAGIVPDADRPELLARLTERENLCSTAVGHGAAIPHAYFDKLPEPMVVISRLAAPVEFCSPDGQMVDLVFVLLGPERVPARHIQILSKIMRMIKDEQFDADMRAAADSDAVLTALRNVEKRHH